MGLHILKIFILLFFIFYKYLLFYELIFAFVNRNEIDLLSKKFVNINFNFNKLPIDSFGRVLTIKLFVNNIHFLLFQYLYLLYFFIFCIICSSFIKYGGHFLLFLYSLIVCVTLRLFVPSLLDRLRKI